MSMKWTDIKLHVDGSGPLFRVRDAAELRICSINNAIVNQETWAQLFAAAPDFAKAAQSYEAWVEAYRDHIPPDFLSAMENAFGAQVRAALRRARGES